MQHATVAPDPFEFLGSDGEVATIIRQYDWSATPLGRGMDCEPESRNGSFATVPCPYRDALGRGRRHDL